MWLDGNHVVGQELPKVHRVIPNIGPNVDVRTTGWDSIHEVLQQVDLVEGALMQDLLREAVSRARSR